MNLRTAVQTETTPQAWSVSDGLRYGLLGLPLAFCALPLYVLMPNLYARHWGVSLMIVVVNADTPSSTTRWLNNFLDLWGKKRFFFWKFFGI